MAVLMEQMLKQSLGVTQPSMHAISSVASGDSHEVQLHGRQPGAVKFVTSLASWDRGGM